MPGYTIKRLEDVPDVLGDYPGEMRMLTSDLGAEQVALTYRRMPQHTGGMGSYGERGRFSGRGPKGYQRSDDRIREDINERLTDLTLHDPLTGLANRVLFSDRLEHAVERSRRSKERVAVLFIDFDRFKRVNDTLGHAAGDELLRQAAERMRRAVRPADTIARLGGDEFTVLCEDLGAVNDAGWVADRLSDTLERPFDLFGSEMSIGVSIGIAVADRHDSAETVLAKADAAMYRTKNDRREWQGAA